MKNPLKGMLGTKSKSAAQIEAELEKLGRKLADHQRRRSELLQSAEEARAAWRESLAEDDDLIATAKSRVDQLEKEADDAGRTIAEYEFAIGAAEERFRAASADEGRRAAAAALEATSKKVDALKTELEKDVAKVASAARKLLAALPGEMGVFPVLADARPGERPERRNEFASSREAVAAVLAEALLAELPELFDFARAGNYTALGLLAVGDPMAARIEPMAWHRRDAMGLPAGAAIDALISSRLRDRAAKILAGEIDVDGAKVEIVKPYREPPPPAETRVVGLTNFKFLYAQEAGYKPRYQAVTEGSEAYVRDEIAQAAMRRGWAALHGSPEAIRKIGEVRSRKSSTYGFGPSIDTFADLGDPLGFQRAYDQLEATDNDNGVDEAMAIAGLDPQSGGLVAATARGT